MSAAAVIALCAVFSDPSFYMSDYRQGKICEIMPDVVRAAEKNGIDPFLLAGLITVESNWNQHAVSSAGACGLTQVMPKYTGGRATKGIKYTCSQLKGDPKVAIKAGSDILSWWLVNYASGHIPTALCGYYSGFTCKPIHKSGKRYYEKVFKNRDKIRKVYEAKSLERTATD